MELHPRLLQIGHHGQDHGLVLVVPGEAQGAEVGQAADVVDIAADVEFHLQGGVPVLKSEHGPPVEPEVGGEHLGAEEVGDGPVVELLVGGEEQPHDLHGPLVGQAELPVGAGVLSPVHRGPAQGVVGVPLVQIVILVQDGLLRGLDGGDGAEQIPHHLEVVVHLPPAPHDVAQTGVLPAVAGPARDGVLLEDVDVPAGHLSVPHQIAGGGEGGQAGAHDVGGLALHALGPAGVDERLIVSAGIVHKQQPPLIWMALL